MTKKKSLFGTIFLAIMLLVAACLGLTACGDGKETEDDPSEGMVAKVGSTYYETLADAVEGATAGSTVTLVSNVTLTEAITIDKDLTLDLGGKTITGTGVISLITIADGSYTINSNDASQKDENADYVEVTIQNGTITSDRPQLILISKYDYVTAINLNLYCTANAKTYDSKSVVSFDYYAYDTNGNSTGTTYVFSTFKYVSGTMTTAETVDACGMYGIGCFSSCTVILGTNGYDVGPTIQSSMACVGMNNLYSNPAYLYIYGGNYSRLVGNGGWTSASWLKWNCVFYISADSEITISGGTFANADTDTNSSIISIPYPSALVHLTISGGSFNAGYKVFYVGSESAIKGSDTGDTSQDQISITGGSFTEVTPDAEGATSFSSYLTGVSASTGTAYTENEKSYTPYSVG